MKRVLLFTLLLTQAVWAQDHWVTAWAAAPQAMRGGPARPGTTPPPTAFNNQTVRMTIRPTLAGSRARFQFSNAFGTKPLTIGAAHVAMHGKGSAIEAATDKAVLFAGKASYVIPPGALVISDPVDINIARLGDLAVSVYLPGDTGPLTVHALGLHTTYITKEGDFTAKEDLTDPTTSQSWYFLSAMDVMAPRDAFAIVTFGDSITDGATSTPDTDRSWPSVLAARMPANVAIDNQGISGNRVLADGAGVSALARFDRDVIALSGVKWVTLMESINDIGIGTRANANAADKVTADDLIAGLSQLAERAHTHGIKVAGATLTPYEGAAYYSAAGEPIREAVNQWIRTSGMIDTVLDYDAVVRDPDHPGQFRKEFNNTDHLHPNDAGYKAMAESVDMAVFTAKKPHKSKKK